MSAIATPTLSVLNLSATSPMKLQGSVVAGVLNLSSEIDTTGAVDGQVLEYQSSGGVVVWKNASGGSTISPGNPTATIGQTAVNGTAITFMRSDAAPVLPLATNSSAGAMSSADKTDIQNWTNGTGTNFNFSSGIVHTSLNDANNHKVIDFVNGYLMYAGGTFPSVDFRNGLLLDSFGNTTVNYGTYSLYNGSGGQVVSWSDNFNVSGPANFAGGIVLGDLTIFKSSVWNIDDQGFHCIYFLSATAYVEKLFVNSGSLSNPNAPIGTLVSPPSVSIGEQWLDTTTSSQYPIVRQRVS